MYFPEMRNECPMRGNLGNCSPVGGFCPDAVSDEICEAVHNAYQKGWTDAIDRIKSVIQQEKQEKLKLNFEREDLEWLKKSNQQLK